VRAAVCDDGVEITIADGGPGVPERDREAIFTPFFTTKEHSTGLGLAIAREFVRRQHAPGGRLPARLHGRMRQRGRRSPGTVRRRAGVYGRLPALVSHG
jgi:C4-dicarboxylate-specific signal transduction histidine kinase